MVSKGFLKPENEKNALELSESDLLNIFNLLIKYFHLAASLFQVEHSWTLAAEGISDSIKHSYFHKAVHVWDLSEL